MSKEYNIKNRKYKKVVSKSGKTYYRERETGNYCIDCDTPISRGCSRCHPCRGYALQDNNNIARGLL